MEIPVAFTSMITKEEGFVNLYFLFLRILEKMGVLDKM